MMDQLNKYQHVDSKKLIQTLRVVLKSKRLTYANLATKLKVSEVTIKRLFSTQNCHLQTIFKICDVIGISFFDLAALAQQDREEDFFLSTEQEKFFAGNPALFSIFRSLHRGMNPSVLAGLWKLDSAKAFKVFRKLEKLGLLDVLPKNQIRLKAKGTLRFQPNGPLAKVILRPQNLQFLDHVDNVIKNEDVCLHSAEVELSKKHITEFVAEIHALGGKYRARALRDKNLLSSDKLSSVRWLFAFAPYQTNWQQYEIKEL